MSKKIEILFLSVVLVIVLISFKFAYGANSLAELKNEVTHPAGYRAELEQYIIDHKMSIAFNVNGEPPLEGESIAYWMPMYDLRNLETNTMDLWSIEALETFVKEHMKICEPLTKGSLGNVSYFMRGYC
jgi:hypothetical protein